MAPAPTSVGTRMRILERTGHLEQMEKEVIMELLSRTPLSSLKKLLSHYSVRGSSISSTKAIAMCHLRYFKGSEAGRREAFRIFQQDCSKWLDCTKDTLLPVMEITNLTNGQDNHEAQSSSGASDMSFELESDPVCNPTAPPAEDSTPYAGSLVILPQRSFSKIDWRSAVMDHRTSFSSADLDRMTIIENDQGVRTVRFPVAELKGVNLRNRKAIVPTVLGIAEPAFFSLDNCLTSLVFDALSPMDQLTYDIEFDVPELLDSQKVIFVTRPSTSMEASFPVGLQWTLNERASSSLQKLRQSPLPKTKDYDAHATVFGHPFTLDAVQKNAKNHLEFSFPKHPESRRDLPSKYHGYLFVATTRSSAELVEKLPYCDIRDSAWAVWAELSGEGARTAYGKITLPLNCDISYAPLRCAARGLTCDHAAVFEADMFLALNKSAKQPKWRCTRCESVIHWYQLRKDSLVEHLLKIFPNCSKVMAQLDPSKENLVFTGIPREPESDADRDD